MGSVEKTSVGHRPKDRWEFDGDVTEVFDDMLRRSIPQHDEMRRAVFEIGTRFVQERTAIVDLGTSRGEAVAPFVSRFGAHNRFVLVETSEPMLEVVRERYSGLIEADVVEVRDLDLRRDYPPASASLTLSVLTLQFVPIEHRQRVVSQAYASTLPGGALILVEKVLGGTGPLNDAFVDAYHEMKAEHGYSRDEIDRKALSLQGVLVPVTATWNEDLLLTAGFDEVDCFWRWMNFAAWIAVKR